MRSAKVSDAKSSRKMREFQGSLAVLPCFGCAVVLLLEPWRL